MSFRLKADYDEMVKKNQELESKLLQMVVLVFHLFLHTHIIIVIIAIVTIIIIIIL